MLPCPHYSIPFAIVVLVLLLLIFLSYTKWCVGKFKPFSETNFLVEFLLAKREDYCPANPFKLPVQRMDLGSTQFVPTRRMGIFEPMMMWEGFKSNDCLGTTTLPEMILEVDAKLDNQSEDTSHGATEPYNKNEEEASKPEVDKAMRRLTQNREAARKSRLRKKAYVQQLENSKLKLIQLEQELGQARQQGLHIAGGFDANRISYPGMINQGITTFETNYGHWVEEQNRQISSMRMALQLGKNDLELRLHVDRGMKHYFDLFNMKAMAARADVFYVMSGKWKTPAERLFFWIGGFRSSEILKVLMPHLEPLTEQQRVEVGNLRQLCGQAEDALTQGMEKLKYIIAETIAGTSLGEGNYLSQIDAAIDKLEALVRFVGQADHLRQETLLQVSRLLTTRQAARGFLALGEYFQRLRALSSLWSSRPNVSPPN